MDRMETTDRLIPLPKQFDSRPGATHRRNTIGIRVGMERTPVLGTALATLEATLGTCRESPEFTVFLDLMDKEETDRFTKPGVAGQAYAIEPVMEKGACRGIRIRGGSSTGVYYGVCTFLRALTVRGGEVDIPLLKVLDWPDIAFRGQWGGSCERDVAKLAPFRFNAVDEKVSFSEDASGQAVVLQNEAFYETAESFGVDVAAVIVHLEQVSRIFNFLRDKPGILNTPSEERGKRSDYVPGLCMSSRETQAMVTEWILLIAKNPMVKKILVWLSEEATPCWCAKCKGREPFALEVDALLQSHRSLKEMHPQVELGIMLSQGSFPVTRELAGKLPPEVTLTYYDGGRTYDSGQYEMILPELAEYVKNGGKLGIYPQITHSWRTVFPMRSPSFIRYRCREFAEKDLHRVIGYAVPDNRYHDFNLVAFLEWLWNSKGRDTEGFCKAYALENGLDPEGYLKYIMAVDKPSWDLAHSRLFVRLMYHYPLILRSALDFGDHRFEMANVLAIPDLDMDIGLAEKAIAIAREMDNPILICEAKCLLGGLMAYRGLTGFMDEKEPKGLLAHYGTIREASVLVYENILEWSALLLDGGEKPHSRVMDTAVILLRALDGMKRHLEGAGVFPKDSQRVLDVGEWTEKDFGMSGQGLTFDVTGLLLERGPGLYHVCMDFVDSQSGTDIRGIHIKEMRQDGGERIVARVAGDTKRLSMWEAWVEYAITVRGVLPEHKYALCLDANGPAESGQTCRGMAGLRKLDGLPGLF